MDRVAFFNRGFMFGVVKLGSHQFKVKAGDFVRVPFQNCSKGEFIELPLVAFSDGKNMIIDSTQLKKSKVKAVLLRQSLNKKVLVFKKKRRKGYRRTKGHRQKVSELKILELISPEGKQDKVEWKVDSKKTSSSKVKKDKVTKKASQKQSSTSQQKTSADKKKASASKKIAPKKTAPPKAPAQAKTTEKKVATKSTAKITSKKSSKPAKKGDK